MNDHLLFIHKRDIIQLQTKEREIKNMEKRAIQEISYYFGLKEFKKQYYSEATETWEYTAIDEHTNKRVSVEFSIVPLADNMLKFKCDYKWNTVEMIINVHIENADLLINRCLFVGKKFNDIYGRYLFSNIIELDLSK